MRIYFLLCLLGATAAQPFYIDGDHHHPRGFGALDDSELVVKAFLIKMYKTIETKDSGAIADLFTEDFFFKGCKGDYDKNKIVALIGKLPAGAAFSFTFKSAKYLSPDKIDYSVVISGFGPSPIEAQFLLCAKTGKLSGGSVPACKRTHFHGLVGGNAIKRLDASHDLVEEFMTKMAKFYKTQDSMIIAELFQPNFTFKSCDVIYNKKEAVTIMTAVPLSSSFIYRISSVSDQGEVIECKVPVDGLGQTDVQFNFVLNKHHLKLESAGFAACPTPPPASRRQLIGWKNLLAPAFEDSNTVITEFLNTLKQIIASHDSAALGNIFDDSFVFKGCKGSYSKAEIISKIARIPEEANFRFTLKSSNWNNYGQIEYNVTIIGALLDDFDAQFVYCPYRKVLKSGSIPSCHSTSSRRRLVDEPCKLEGEEWIPKDVDPLAATHCILYVLSQRINLKAKESEIARLFNDNFVFKGCKGSYTKADVLKKIAQLPKDAEVELTKKSAKWINDTEIEFVATISGDVPETFDAQFVYVMKKHHLKSASRLSCPAKRMFTEPCMDIFGFFCF